MHGMFNLLYVKIDTWYIYLLYVEMDVWNIQFITSINRYMVYLIYYTSKWIYDIFNLLNV